MAHNMTSNVLEEMRDIQGLDPITAWPLALGWWLVIILVATVLIIGGLYVYKRYKYRRSWQYGYYATLQNIEDQLKNSTAADYKKILHQLAVAMRQIAMQSFKRETCAGLVGKQWLTWLQQHDPSQFAWESNGQVLVDFQYMPEVVAVESATIKRLIVAAKQWVKKC